jgi:hypothetical protein
VVVWQGQVYAITTREIWQLQGSGADSFYPIPLKAKTGTIAQDTAHAVAGFGIFHLAYDGVYLWNGSEDERISDNGFKTMFTDNDVEATPAVNMQALHYSWIIQSQNNVYLGLPTGTNTFASDILVMDTGGRQVVQYRYPKDFAGVAYDSSVEALIAVDEDGAVWVLEQTDKITDNGTAISWDIQSKQFNGTLRKYFPRYARYDIEGVATCQIILDGSAKQNHAVVSRNTRKRLVVGCTGDRLQLRAYGTDSVTIHQMEVE